MDKIWIPKPFGKKIALCGFGIVPREAKKFKSSKGGRGIEKGKRR